MSIQFFIILVIVGETIVLCLDLYGIFKLFLSRECYLLEKKVKFLISLIIFYIISFLVINYYLSQYEVLGKWIIGTFCLMGFFVNIIYIVCRSIFFLSDG